MMNNLSFDKKEMTKWDWGNFFEILIPSSGVEWFILSAFVLTTIFVIIAIWDGDSYGLVIMFTALDILLMFSYIVFGIEDYNESLVEDGKSNLQEVAFESISGQYDLDQSRINNIEYKIDEEDNKVTLDRLIFDYDDLASSTTYELNFVFDDNGTAQIMKTDSVTDEVIKQFEK